MLDGRTYVTLANMSIGPTVPLNGQETGSAFGSAASAGGSVGMAATKVVKPQRPRRKEEANIVDDGICDGTFLLAVRYIGSVVDDIDGGGKKVTGDISWGEIVEERENRMIIIRIIRTCLSTTKLYVGTFTIPNNESNLSSPWLTQYTPIR